MVLGYVLPFGDTRERLVELKDIKDKTRDGQATAILNSLRSKEFNTKSIAFQSNDYTSSMSGKLTGCQANMTEFLEKETLYFTCFAHRINTTVEYNCRKASDVFYIFNVLEMCFFTSNTKRLMIYKTKVKAKNLLAHIKCFEFIL